MHQKPKGPDGSPASGVFSSPMRARTIPATAVVSISRNESNGWSFAILDHVALQHGPVQEGSTANGRAPSLVGKAPRCPSSADSSPSRWLLATRRATSSSIFCWSTTTVRAGAGRPSPTLSPMDARLEAVRAERKGIALDIACGVPAAAGHPEPAKGRAGCPAAPDRGAGGPVIIATLVDAARAGNPDAAASLLSAIQQAPRGAALTLSGIARRALAWLLPNGEPRTLEGSGRPAKSALAALRRRKLAEPVDASGSAWRRTPAGDQEAARG
jgi:hypothetical protein